MMPRGAGLSLASGAGGTQHLCILKLGSLGKIIPRIAVSLQKVELEGNGEARRELLPGAGSRGGPGRDGVTLRCCGLSEGKVGWRERREEGMEEGEGSPRGGKGLCPLRTELRLVSLGRQGRGGGGWRQPGQAGGRKGKLGYHG